MPDKEGYPTREELKKIRYYSLKEGNLHENVLKLIDYIKSLWWHPESGIILKGKNLELHTLGWSGNEEIIGALMGSEFWKKCFVKDYRGGHYYFDLNKILEEKK